MPKGGVETALMCVLTSSEHMTDLQNFAAEGLHEVEVLPLFLECSVSISFRKFV